MSHSDSYEKEGQDGPVLLTWLPDNFLVNWPFCSREVQYRFSWWLPWQTSRISNRNNFSYFDLQLTLILPMKFWVNWPFGSEEQGFKQIWLSFWPNKTHVHIWPRYHQVKHSDKVSWKLEQSCGFERVNKVSKQSDLVNVFDPIESISKLNHHKGKHSGKFSWRLKNKFGLQRVKKVLKKSDLVT